MNKLFKLIYVNLLGLFDINKIIVAREDGVKSNLEKRLVITGIIVLFYGFLIYNFLGFINFKNSFLILSIGFIISSVVCFISNLPVIEPTIFKNDDNDILFSLPVSRHQILFSKLFTIYLKNLLLVFVIMFSCLLSFYTKDNKVTDTMLIMYLLSSLIIPLVPMILSTIITYFSDYYKVKMNNNWLYKISKFLVFVIILVLLLLLFIRVEFKDIESGIEGIIKTFNCIYPFNYLFYKSLSNENIITFLLLMILPVAFIYLYMVFITNNYLKICSMLKGIKKKENFVYKKVLNLHKLFGMIKKEMTNLFSNKFYLSSSFSTLLLFSVLLFVVLNIIEIDELRKIENMNLYLSLYVPTILGMLSTLSGSAISAMSLEKENMQMLITMPISIWKIILAKWLTNVFISLIFVILNGTMTWYFLKTDGWETFFNFFVPFIAVLFVSLTSLILDFRFFEKGETDDNSIIKHRLVNIIPSFISVFIGLGVFFLPIFDKYKLILGSYCFIMIVAMICEIIYFMINKKRLIRGLFN